MKKIIVLCLMIFVLATTVNAWTTYSFRARQEQGDRKDWGITTVPQVILDSEAFQTADRLGGLSCLIISRQDRTWDEKPLFTGWWLFEDDYVDMTMKKVVSLMKYLDKVYPEGNIGLCWFADLDCVTLYFPGKYQDKEFHIDITDILNGQRDLFFNENPNNITLDYKNESIL